VYHLELHQFPRKLCRFNLTADELRAVAEPWAHDQWLEFGEQKWSPHTARLTILEGPEIPVQQLSMGRGWRAAQRQSEDVTAPVLAAARAPRTGVEQAPTDARSPDAGLFAESLGIEVLSLLGDDAASLLSAWRLIAARSPELSSSECLALAEQAVRSSGANAS
jgi:hypothetical protein